MGLLFVFTSSAAGPIGRRKKAQGDAGQPEARRPRADDRRHIGSVVETRDNEVVVKVDEGSNTKIRVVREAIKRVVTAEEAKRSNSIMNDEL
jgi:hypothetical protein